MKENVPAEQAVTSMERPLPAREATPATSLPPRVAEAATNLLRSTDLELLAEQNM